MNIFINFCIYRKLRFPLDKSDILKKWLDNMGIKNWIPNSSNYLCSEHFEQTCFRKIRGKYWLKDGSVPTIFKVEYFNNIKSGKIFIFMFYDYFSLLNSRY